MSETDKRIQYKKDWYQKNKGRTLELNKKWKNENRKEVNKKALKYYYENREARKEYQRKWKRDHKKI